MIVTDRTITVRKGVSSIDDPVIVYRGDYEVAIRFTIMNNKFKYMSGVNMIESEKASYGQLAILTPYGGNVFSDMVRCSEGAVAFVMSKELMDQIEEVGLYSFQIRLFDGNRESRISIPPVEFGIEIREPVASEDHDNTVNNAIIGYSIAKVVDGLNEDVPDAFDANGRYNKTDWETGDRITEGKLNKIEDALDKINQNEKADVAALDKRITSNYNVLESNKADKNEIFSLKNMGQDIKEAMTGGSVAVVGKNAILSENIVDKQVTLEKLEFEFKGMAKKPNTITIEDLVTEQRGNNTYFTLPTSDNVLDIFFKFTISNQVTSATTFICLNGAYSNPIGLSGFTSGDNYETCTLHYNNNYISPNKSLKRGETYYLRISNSAGVINFKIYSILGELIGSLDYEENITLKTLRVVGVTGVSVYDYIVSDGILSDDSLNNYLFIKDKIVDGILYKDDVYSFKNPDEYLMMNDYENNTIANSDTINAANSPTYYFTAYNQVDIAINIKVDFKEEYVDKLTTMALLNSSWSNAISLSHTSDGSGYYMRFNSPDPLKNSYKLLYGNTYIYRIVKSNKICKINVYDENLNLSYTEEHNLEIDLSSITIKHDCIKSIKILNIALSEFDFLNSNKKLIDGVYNKSNKVFATTDTFIKLYDGNTLNNYIKNTSRFKDKTIVCFGDSITGNYKLPYDYPSFVAKYTGAKVYNCGFGGCRMSTLTTESTTNPLSMPNLVDAILSKEWTTQQQAASSLSQNHINNLNTLERIDFNQVDYITIFYGTNDFTSKIPLDDDDDDKFNIHTYAGACRYSLKKLLENYPHLKFLLITPMFRSRQADGDGKNSDEYDNGVGVFLYGYANKLIEVAKEFKVPYINMYEESCINKYNSEYYLEDGLHPNEAGREKIGSCISGNLMSKF